MHDLVAGGLELAYQLRHRYRRCVLEIMHKQDAFTVLGELRHRRFDHVFRLAQLEIEGVDIGRKDRDVAGAEISDQFGRLLQSGEAEERRD